MPRTSRKQFKAWSFNKWLSLALVLVFVQGTLFAAEAATSSLSVTILPAVSEDNVLEEKKEEVEEVQQQQQQQQNIGFTIAPHSISVGGGSRGGKNKNKNKNKNKGKGPTSVGISISGSDVATAGTGSSIHPGPKGPAPGVNPNPNGPAPSSVTAGPQPPKPPMPQPGVKTFAPVLAETKTVIQAMPHVSEEKVEHIVELKQEGFKNIREIKSMIQEILEQKKALEEGIAEIAETESEGTSSLAADFSSVISDVVEETSSEPSTTSSGSVSVVDDSSSDSEEETVEEDTLDYEDHWAETYIEVVKVMDLASGKDEEGNFEPNEPITRAEFIKMTVNAMGYDVADSVTEGPFTDVDVEDWHAPYLSVAKQVGLIEGFEDGSFEPSREVTRAEVMKVLILGVMDVQFEVEEDEDVLEKFGLVRPPFVDLSVQKWYAPYVLYSSEIGLVSGYEDFTFRPNSFMTRAELSKVIVETLEHVYSEDERLSILAPLQLSEEGLEPGAVAGLDSEHDFSLWERIRRWSLQKSLWR